MKNSKNVFYQVSLVFSLLLTSTLLSSCQQEEGFFLRKKVIKKIYPGIVEVIIPKQEDKSIVYQRPLPFDQLDYKQRNDKFYAIGTAFFISPTRLISAAHVISADSYSTYKDFKIRTSDGEVYDIGKIYRYSTYRDVIEFDLKSYPKSVTTLKLQPKVEIGDMVYAVGNAGGEGISTRGGQVSTFTPEPVSGEWDYIRFSSPASPGNSGGPLVNHKGEVVGIVVMKNNSENLNFALPVAQIEKSSAEHAIFLTRKMKVQDGMQVLVKDWKFHTSLPAKLIDLRNVAIPEKDKFYGELISEFKEKYRPLIFPYNERFRDSLLYQPLYSRLSVVDKDQALVDWNINPINLKKIVVSKDNILYHAKGDVFENILLFLPAAGETPIGLIKSPRTLLNRALKASGANRYMAGQRIPIEDHGEPNESFYWTDKMGRPWYTSRWEVLYSDSVISTHCGPTPEGVYCFIDHGSSDQKFNGYMHFVKENILEVNISYTGNLKQWLDFQNIDSKFQPPVLKNFKLKKVGKKILVTLKDQQRSITFPLGNSKRLAESKNFRMSSLISYDPSANLRPTLQGVEVLFNKNSSEGFTIYKSYQAQSMAPDEIIERWNNIESGLGRFNGKAHVDGDQNMVFLKLGALKAEAVLSSVDGKSTQTKDVKRQWMLTCFSPSTKEKTHIVPECQKQLKSITFQ